jgi:3-hydroxyacyl-CoA dehydrogenase
VSEGIRVAARTVQTVGIIGAGLMGRSIARVNLEHGPPVVLTDVSRTALDQAAEGFRQEVPDHTARLRLTSNLAELASCDLVLEAIVESLKVKRQILAQLETLAPRAILLASNTSCLTVAQIAAGLTAPERVCALHFCHPVRLRHLVEVVAAEATSEVVITTACAYVQALGMEALRVKDTPGFVVNRVLNPYLNKALTLLDEGAGIEEVDAAGLAAGMPWGPITQIDEIGIDVVLRGGQIMAQAYPAEPPPAELLIQLFSLGRLGRKTGAGFYRYQADQAPSLDSEIQDLLGRRAKPKQLSLQVIEERLTTRLARECRRIVDEGIVPSFDEVALALVKGLGFDERKVAALR